MLNSIFGYWFLFVGLLILVLPLILVELSRPRDWLRGGLFLFLGLFLLVENDFLRGSLNLLISSIVILYGLLMSEIIQNRYNQLSFEEKKRIGSLKRWSESLKQLGQVFALIGNELLNFLKSFSTQSEKKSIEKKWVRPELKEESQKEVLKKSDSKSSNKIINHELNEKEETS